MPVSSAAVFLISAASAPWSALSSATRCFWAATSFLSCAWRAFASDSSSPRTTRG